MVEACGSVLRPWCQSETVVSSPCPSATRRAIWNRFAPSKPPESAGLCRSFRTHAAQRIAARTASSARRPLRSGLGGGILLFVLLLVARRPGGHRLSRQLLVAHRRVVDERGEDAGRLHQVRPRRALDGVHVRVVRAARIVELVLYELEAGQTERVEREMVGAARVAQRDGVGAQVPERLEPRLEDRTHRRVLLTIDAANPARAVVEVEVGGELRMLGLDGDGAGRLPLERREEELARLGGERTAREVLRDVGPPPVEPPLPPPPEPPADARTRP